MSEDEISVIGAGLAGAEAAWQAARRGLQVTLYEMRPVRNTPAHKTGLAAELVCSNSLGNAGQDNAKGVLQREMRMLGSLIMEAADAWRVPAGGALAVDRHQFSKYVEDKLNEQPNIEIVRREVTGLPQGNVIIAAGPLVSDALAQTIGQMVDSDFLHFIDAISPIVGADSIDMSIAYEANRYGKGDSADYINCPLDETEYDRLVQAILDAEKVPPHEFENEKKLFEACMPIEDLAARGRMTLAFGPCKPVGLEDPQTGKRPFAVVQLRKDDINSTAYNIVGFQTRMTYPAQKQVIRLIPGLQNARFLRLGSVHRNTYINAPALLDEYLRLKNEPRISFAGQIAGSEGYLESATLGLYSGICASFLQAEKTPPIPHVHTAIGALLRGLRDSNPKRFNPVSMQFGIFDPPSGRHNKKERKKIYSERALAAIDNYIAQVL